MNNQLLCLPDSFLVVKGCCDRGPRALLLLVFPTAPMQEFPRHQPFPLQEGLEGLIRKMDLCPFPWCSPQSGLALTHVEELPKQCSTSIFKGTADWEPHAWEKS